MIQRIKELICRRFGHKEGKVGTFLWSRFCFCKRCGKLLWTEQLNALVFLDAGIWTVEHKLVVNVNEPDT